MQKQPKLSSDNKAYEPIIALTSKDYELLSVVGVGLITAFSVWYWWLFL